MSSYDVRRATAGDVAVLAYQRCAMFKAMGMLAPGEQETLTAATIRYLEGALPAGHYVAWVAEQGGTIIAGAGIQLRALVPRPGYVRGEPEALVLSMWCEPEHRRRGAATRVMQAILDWCREQGIRRVTLHASPMGRPLYERLGFTATNEMRLELPEARNWLANEPEASS